jgi:transglutaminase-like putative cysteine protease
MNTRDPSFRVPFLASALAVLALSACSSPSEEPAAPARSARFAVRHELDVKVPEGTRELRVWMALPQDDEHEDLSKLAIDAPIAHEVREDDEGNRVLYLRGEQPLPASFKIVETFEVERREQSKSVDPSRTRPLNAAERKEHARLLESNEHIVIDDGIRELSREIVGDETNPVLIASKVYDWTLENVDYWVKDPKSKKASPVGSSEYCLSSRTGNCTDFHSLYAALTRAAGVPTRILYGSFLKKELDGQDVDQSYHCWIEFLAPGIGWVPLDVAIADIFVGDFATTADNQQLVARTTAAGYSGADPALVRYYFGNLEERRVLWSVGRDLELDPRPAAGPVNALAKAHVEADGKPLAEKEGWTRKLTYTELR